MPRHISILIILSTIWALLSGHFNTLLISFGFFSCLLSYVVFLRMTQQLNWTVLKFNPIKQGLYLLWLFGEIIKANFDVISAILRPNRLAPQLFEVDTEDLDEIGKVVYANSITLTPGTVTTQISENRLQVHSLLAASKNSLDEGEMLSKVKKLMAQAD